MFGMARPPICASILRPGHGQPQGETVLSLSSVTFHHDPGHDDRVLDRLTEEARRAFDLPFQLIPGTEGSSFDLEKR